MFPDPNSWHAQAPFTRHPLSNLTIFKPGSYSLAVFYIAKSLFCKMYCNDRIWRNGNLMTRSVIVCGVEIDNSKAFLSDHKAFT